MRLRQVIAGSLHEHHVNWHVQTHSGLQVLLCAEQYNKRSRKQRTSGSKLRQLQDCWQMQQQLPARQLHTGSQSSCLQRLQTHRQWLCQVQR